MGGEGMPIRIKFKYSPNPEAEQRFTVKCHRHRIRTTVTATPSVVRRWIYHVRCNYGHLRGKLVVGLGVQWRPEDRNTPATLQLCIGSNCLVFQLCHAPAIPRCLRRFLNNPSTTFVGVWNYNDRYILESSEHKIELANLVDIRIVAAEWRGFKKQASMEKLAEGILDLAGVEKPKSVGRSNWTAYWLSDEQVLYACLDAFLPFAMGKELEVWEWGV